VELDALSEVIDRLAALDPTCVGDAGAISVLEREFSRLEAVLTRAVAAFDASGDWAGDGAKSAAAWVATTCHLPRSHAARQVRRGRMLRHLALVDEAWGEGAINAAHLDTMASLRRPATEEALARDEAMLVKEAKALRFEHFAKVAAYWDQLADPDGTEEAAEARRARRDVFLAQSISGMYLGQMTLDPISGAIVSGEFERLERQLFLADWAKATEALGREPTLGELARTPAQRRADALVEMATRSRTAPADGRRPQPLFSVLVDYETLHGRVCELAQGAALSPGSLVPWLEQSWIERAVFEPGGRVEVSVWSRLFNGGTRRALVLRDRECTHEFCDIPAHRCQADHILPWSAGGLTSQDNGRLLCGFHNRLRHQRPPPDG
jgi:Domain of unknown function (DUF222)